MQQMCNGAIENGVREIGFTDHYDLHHNEECRNYLKIDSWIVELERVRAEFDGRLIIRASIELGEPHIFQKEGQAMLARYPFDYTSARCIGSARKLFSIPIILKASTQRSVHLVL